MSRKDRFNSGGPDGDSPTSLIRDVDRLVHKLRTPLNSMALNADLLATVGQPKPGKESLYQRALKSLQNEVGRLDQIASDFQLYVGAADPRRVEVPVAGIIAEAVKEAADADGGRSVEVKGPPSGVRVRGDSRLLRAALLELLKNAIEAGEGPVQVECRVEGQEVLIDVSDSAHGFGFDPPDRAFELFMGDKQGHLGFGLTFARRIVRMHGGEIELASSGKSGSRVRIRLPAERSSGGSEQPGGRLE